MNSKLGQESAFPLIETKDTESVEPGMSKRFYAACAAMNGMLSGDSEVMFSQIITGNYAKDCIKASYKLADELLKQENNEAF